MVRRRGARGFVESSLLGALAEVLLVNLVLSGDNAVVIGLAARDLSIHARRRAIALGGGLAVVLRLLLTLPAEYLLHVAFVRAGGGLLLGWVAYRLLTEEEGETGHDEAKSIGHAVRLIVLADATMSLDNILAVAAVAERSAHDILVLIVGLAISIPIVLVGGDIVARLMKRLPILSWIGGAILAYTAGELIADDEALDRLFGAVAHLPLIFALLVTVLVVGVAMLRVRRSRREAARAETLLPIVERPGRVGHSTGQTPVKS
jgi:YjbE family integral membrane protein